MAFTFTTLGNWDPEKGELTQGEVGQGPVLGSVSL